MSNRTLFLDQRIYDYLLSISLRESASLQRLREETATVSHSNMQIAPEQGQFMALLVQLMGVSKALEIGTYTGYSALCMALAMPEQGELICCDISDEWTSVARRYWKQAGVGHKIDLRLAPALDTLDELLARGLEGQFDFAFIDADKQNYVNYYERCLQLLRPGGLIVVDNTLWDGAVADPDNNALDTCAIREFNQVLRDDARVALSLVPIGDGLTLVRV
ncbi:MAG: SAM-dependent methyltransferase [Gammaproteobacteria bacterium]|nr:SAM-dependent methyltransferase [Gammaproteobacteria bacterium]